MSLKNHTIEREELMAYLDGELSPGRAAEAASHLAQCKECQTLAKEFGEVSKGLLSWQTEAASSNIDDAIANALDKLNVPAQRKTFFQWLRNPETLRRRGWQLAGVGCLAALVVAIAATNLVRRQHMSAMTDQIQELDARLITGDEIKRVPGALPQKAPSTKSAKNRNDADYAFSLDASKNTDGAFAPPPPPAPMATPIGPQSLTTFGNEDRFESEQQIDGQNSSDDSVNNGPMIVRTAQLAITIKDFGKGRNSMEEILKRYHGYIGDLTVNTPNGSARSLNAKLRIPSAQLDAALTALKALGRIDAEAQNGEEVTQQYVDLTARLGNARKTEQRLIEIQRDRTGKLSDVLSVEMQISRVRGEIEQMEAERKTLAKQVSFASLDLTLTEEYKADLKVPPSLGIQLWNAGIDGIRSLRDSILGVLFWLLSIGPTLLLWILILFYPARIVWKKLRLRLIPAA